MTSAWAAERDGVDQRIGDGRHRLVALAFEVEVLDRLGVGLVAVALDELVVEVLLARAHAADVERDEGAHRCCARRSRSSLMHRLTVGAMSKSSSDLPERSAPSSSSGRSSETCSGREQGRDPAVGDLAGERGVLGADRGEVDRDSLLHGRDRELERLAGPVGERQLERLAVELDAFARERHADDGDVLARALQAAWRSAARASPRRPAGRRSRCRGSCARPRAGRSWRRSSRSSRASGPASGRCRRRGGSCSSARRASRARWRCPSRRPRRPRPSHSRGARPPGRS